MKPELIIESHPQSYDDEPFLTLVKFRDTNHLCIVDNIDKRTLGAFVLDFCSPVDLDPNIIIEHARTWFKSSDYYHMPFSFYLAKVGYSDATKIYHEFQVNNISRLVGPVSYYELRELKKVRRRTRKRS